MKRFLALFCLLLVSGVGAQTRFVKTPEEAKRAAEGIVASAAANNFGGAMNALAELSPVPPREFNATRQVLADQLARASARFGDGIGYELLREEKLGSSLLRYVYLVKHEYGAHRWRFVFYRGKEGWAVTDFTIDGNLDSAFQ